jgi:hypothetical protein
MWLGVRGCGWESLWYVADLTSSLVRYIDEHHAILDGSLVAVLWHLTYLLSISDNRRISEWRSQ